jgi:Natural resistance-associated macrophage protein
MTDRTTSDRQVVDRPPLRATGTRRRVPDFSCAAGSLAAWEHASGMTKPSQPGLLRRVARALGPGLITGAADDDPSGIVTYSMAGAQHGMALLWLAWITWPLMAAVQMMCARIGMVTGKGLGEVLTLKFPRAVVVVACCALFLANTINIAADLAGMGDAASMLFGLRPYPYVVLFGAGIAFAMVRCRYALIAAVLKWLVLSLFAYVVTAFLVHPDWPEVARDLRPDAAARPGDVADRGGHPRHHHQPLSLLLAGLAGGRGANAARTLRRAASAGNGG